MTSYNIIYFRGIGSKIWNIAFLILIDCIVIKTKENIEGFFIELWSGSAGYSAEMRKKALKVDKSKTNQLKHPRSASRAYRQRYMIMTR